MELQEEDTAKPMNITTFTNIKNSCLKIVLVGKNMQRRCSHEEIEFLGEQRGESGVNKYYRCLRCGSVLILSEEGTLYEVVNTMRHSQQI